jgi:hypothetical protein
LKALEVLIVAAKEQVAGGDADELRPWLGDCSRGIFYLLADGMDGAVKVLYLKAQDNVGIGDRRTAAQCLIQRMTAREIHALALIDDGGLQGLGKFHEKSQSRGRPRGAAS